MVLTKARNHRISDPRKICRGKTFLDYYQTEKMEINCGVATWRLKFNLLIVWSAFVVKFTPTIAVGSLQLPTICKNSYWSEQSLNS